jgi:serine/threonine protein phosphatase PrpC
MKIFGYSVLGPRSKNEDYYLYRYINTRQICCIADGVGGNVCGDYASRYCSESFLNHIQNEKSDIIDFKKIVQKINRDLLSEAKKKLECRGMATTFTACSIQNNTVHIIHTGDSRLYWLRSNGLKQMTNDHTEVERLKREGLLTPNEALSYPRRNFLDSALGIEDGLILDAYRFDVEPKDRIILTTDGFHNVFSKAELRDISTDNSNFDNFCKTIKYKTHDKLLKDNASFVIIEID